MKPILLQFYIYYEKGTQAKAELKYSWGVDVRPCLIL